MNIETIKILNKINKYSCWIDISDKNISGILDLNEFNSLRVLICNNNQITEIINISSQLTGLNCANNKITNLTNLINSKEIINFKFDDNPLIDFYYPINKPIEKYPKELKNIIFG